MLDLHRFFTTQRRLDAAYRYGPELVDVRDPRRALADSAEREAAVRLLLEGHQVERMEAYHARFDLLIDGVLRVEVKAARWAAVPSGGGRYQAHFHNRADLVLFLCADVGRWFVIPVEALAGRRNLAIWSYDPAKYGGQWAPYLDAWGQLADLVGAARERGAVALQGRLFQA